MFKNLLRRLRGSSKPVKARKPSLFGRATLSVESLEDRCVPATIAEFPVTSGATPFSLTTGPDGNIWFTEKAGAIGMMNPTSHAVTEFAIPTSTGVPTGITAGPDGNIWFTEANANKIGMINPTTKAITEFTIPTANSSPFDIVAASDGNLWFTEYGTGRIGVINPTTKAITDYAIPSASSNPAYITFGSDGNLWFTEFGNNKLASINPITHAFSEYAIPSGNSQPYGITSGADGNIWFTESNTNKIGKLDLSSFVVTEFVVPGGGRPADIATAADGNLWFTLANGNRIGTVTLPSNTITVTNVPTANSAPAGITVGPNGTLWFAESGSHKIAQVVSSPIVTLNPGDRNIAAGATTTFTVAAVGSPTPTVQWFVSANGVSNWLPLSNSGVYSGVTTTTLTITGATLDMNGLRYQAVFTNGVSPSATTQPALLTVHNVLSLMPGSPQDGVINTPYSQTISVVGSSSPFTLFAFNNFNAGATGLTPASIVANSANGTFTISGTPTGIGNVSFTINVANAAGNTLTQTVTISIKPPLGILTTTLPGATALALYHQTITVVGGAGPYTQFAVTNLDPGTTGLTPGAITADSSTGTFTIHATPLGAGTITFTVAITDALGTTLTKDFTITVNPALAITPTLPSGTANVEYNQVLNITGGGTPYTSVIVSNLSTGATGVNPGFINVDPVAGMVKLLGTPTGAGLVKFTVTVTDATGATLTKTYTITINAALTSTATLPQGTANTKYQQTITVTGGTQPYSVFNISSLNTGTTGLTASAVTVNPTTRTIVISGTPTAAGTLSFTLNVTDGAGATLTKTYTVTINPPLSLSGISALQWTAGGGGFTGVINVTGGTVQYTLLSATNVPTGMTAALKNGTISFAGTPTKAGSYAITVAVRDAAGAVASKTVNVIINAAPTIGNLTISQWTRGQAGFTGTMATTGGTGSLNVFSVTGVPTGLVLSMDGKTVRFVGTPTVVGTFNGTVVLRDAVGYLITKTFTITINATPTIGNLTATQWTKGKAEFAGTLTIAGGSSPFTISAQSGLPTGLTASVVGNTIRFVGTPSAVGTFAGSVTIKDAAGATVTKTFSIVINPPVLIVTPSVPASSMGRLYTTKLTATGGTGKVTFKITAGSMPPGYILNADGTITGLSRGMGSYTFTVTATDSIGATVTKTYTLVVGR